MANGKMTIARCLSATAFNRSGQQDTGRMKGMAQLITSQVKARYQAGE